MMNDPILSEYPAVFSKPLSDLCDAPAPLPSFVSRLERHLLERQAAIGLSAQSGVRQPSLRRFTHRRWWCAVIALFVAILLALLALGPQRVLAELRLLLMYIPGIGFTETTNASLLPAPVTDRRGGVTLQVQQVLAEAKRTVVVLQVEGLTPQEQEPYLYTSHLQLPNGTSLVQKGFGVDPARTILVFGPLPRGVSQFDFIWSDKASAEHAWAIPLRLESARDTRSLRDAVSYPLVDAYLLFDHNMMIRVTEVSQLADQTAVNLQLLWPVNSERMPVSVGRAELIDELGTNYEQLLDIPWDDQGQPIETVTLSGPAAGEYRTTHQILLFRPGAPTARHFMLSLGGLMLREPVAVDFSLDLGREPKSGDHLPLDVSLEAVGVPLHINGARVVDADVVRIDQGGKVLGKQTALEFTLDPLPKDELRTVTWINFQSPQISRYISAGYARDPETGIDVLRLPLETGTGRPLSGQVYITGDWAEVRLPGPFIIPWDMPKP